MYPKKLSNLYLGGKLRIVGRFTPQDKEIGLRLLGKTAGEKKEVIFRKEIPPADSDNHEIARFWALNRIHHLLGTMITQGRKDVWVQEVRALMVEYDIDVPYLESIL